MCEQSEQILSVKAVRCHLWQKGILFSLLGLALKTLRKKNGKG